MSESLRDLAKEYADAWDVVKTTGKKLANALADVLRPTISDLKVLYILDRNDGLFLTVPQPVRRGDVDLDKVMEKVFQEYNLGLECEPDDLFEYEPSILSVVSYNDILLSQQEADQIEQVLKSHLLSAEQEEVEKDE